MGWRKPSPWVRLMESLPTGVSKQISIRIARLRSLNLETRVWLVHWRPSSVCPSSGPQACAGCHGKRAYLKGQVTEFAIAGVLEHPQALPSLIAWKGQQVDECCFGRLVSMNHDPAFDQYILDQVSRHQDAEDCPWRARDGRTLCRGWLCGCASGIEPRTGFQGIIAQETERC